jgi:putative DNA primase/helicase
MATTAQKSNERSTVLDVARTYVAAGLSVVPIRRDGSKAAAVSWTCYQQRRPTDAELICWYGRPEPYGIAIVNGAVSCGLETPDFDQQADIIFPAWCALVEAEAPGLVARLSIVQTPREPAGYHVRYRVAGLAVPGSRKLAKDPSLPDDAQTLIETKGEGGYALAPGSPAECHETGQFYKHIAGPPLTDLPVLTPEERDILIRSAASFNRTAEEDTDAKAEQPTGSSSFRMTAHDLPGTAYNTRGPDWPAILEPHGWVCVRTCGQVRYWRRPGKEKGWSATTGVCHNAQGHELLAVFSSNADPFPGPSGGRLCSCHTKFGAYALLNHGGDFKAAACELGRQGYGSPPRKGNGQASGEPDLPRTGYEIILAYFRTVYEPTFRRDDKLHSAALARKVPPREACFAPGRELIELLGQASDCPKVQIKHEGSDSASLIPNRQAIPKFFHTWAPSAWQDLIAELPEEEAAVEIAASAKEEFRRHVIARLVSQETFTETVKEKTPAKAEGLKLTAEGTRIVKEPQRRSLIHWAALWAKPGSWKPVRSLLLWSRRSSTDELEIALRVELFAQGHSTLGGMSQYQFADLAELYEVGEASKACGRRVVVLCPKFLAELMLDPAQVEAEAQQQAGNGRLDDEDLAHAQ